MALSGTITGKCDNSNYTLTCEWSATQSTTNNTSTITAKVYLKAPSGWSTVSSYWDCTINGTQVTNDKSATVGGTKVLLGQRTWTVTHSSSGTCSTTISFSYSNGLTSYGTYTTKSGSGSASITLNTIPRTSSFTLSKSSMEMGSTQTVTISRASSSFTHTVVYVFGSSTTTVATKTTSTSVSFTPPTSLSSQIPNATSGTCTVKVTTYNGSTSIGTTSKTFTLTTPSGEKPSISLSTTYNNTLNGLSIAGKTTVKVTPSATATTGATIKSYSYSGAGLSGTGSSKTTGTLSAGTYTITVTVTDTRGKTNSASVSFTVYAYSSPTCSVSAYRANSDGSANPSGTHVRLKVSWTVSNPNNANTNAKKYTIQYKKTTDTTWTNYTSNATLASYSGTSNNLNAGSGYSTTSSYNFRFIVTDTYGSVNSICSLSTMSTLLNIEKDGIGVGKIYERGGKLDVGGYVYCDRLYVNMNNNIGAVGVGGSDVYLTNQFTGKHLQLRNDGGLSYQDKNVFYEGNSSYLAPKWLGGTFSSSSFGSVIIERTGSTNGASIQFKNTNGSLGYIGMKDGANGGLYRYSSDGNNQYRVLDSAGGQINGQIDMKGQYLTIGDYNSLFNGVQMKRYDSAIGGNLMAKVGITIADGTSACAIEVGTSNGGSFAITRRYTFSGNYFLAHTNNAVTIGSSTYRFKALYATNGTIQTSDGRYKYIVDDINSEDCFNLIKDMNLYGYSTLNKRIDEYKSISEISDELRQSSEEDMNLNMGFVAQEIESNELSKYILTKGFLDDENGNRTNEYVYGIDNYAYTTAVHGALKHEIKLRQQEVSELKKEIEDLKQQIKKMK